MALTTITGTATTKDPLSNELIIDMRSAIQKLDPDYSQFTTMLTTLPTETANSFKVEWLEDQLFPRLSTLAASATSAATTLTVATGEGAYFRANDLLRIVSTGEAVSVTSIATDTLTVGRAIGTVAAASAASGGDVVIVGNASAQQATLPTILMLQRVTNYNYTQIQRHPYGFSRTAMQTEWYGGPLMDKEREKKAIEHKRAVEQTLFFGARSYSATGPLHTCGGLIEYVTTNIHSAAGTMSKANLQTFLRADLQHGSPNKVLFVAPIVAQVLSAFLQDGWVRAAPDERLWGARVDAVLSGSYAGGEIPVMIKRSWNDFQTGTTNHYGSRAFFIDMENVQFAPMQTTVQLRNRQANDFDGAKEEYLTEHSLKVEIEKSHGLWTNITG